MAPREPKPAAPKPPAKKAAPRSPARRPTKVTALPVPPAYPPPPRPLGPEGMKTWERIWSLRKRWIQTEADLEHVALLCESVDERMSLRLLVLRQNEWRDRVALRALDAQIVGLMGALGLNPTERQKLGAEEEARGKLAALRSNREA